MKLYFIEHIIITLKCCTFFALLLCEEAVEVKEKSWLLLALIITNYVTVVAATEKKNDFFFSHLNDVSMLKRRVASDNFNWLYSINHKENTWQDA